MSPEKQGLPPASPGIVDPTLSQGSDPQAMLAEQARQFETVVQKSEISDQYDFERTRFDLGNVAFVFRGREELPVLSAENAEQAKQVLTTDELPVYTSTEDYKSWRKNQEKGIGKDSTDGEQEIEFFASNTSRGIVDVALKLIETGHGDEDEKDRLTSLRKKLVDDDIDDEVLGLFDMVYTAGAVDLGTGNMVDNRNASPEAPMLVALALSGDKLSQAIINTKRKIVDAEDEKRLFNAESTSLKRPGEPLSDDEIELMKNAHFIAVHTTPTAPKAITEHGDRGIFPTGQYDLGKQIYHPRETIHWSLNHAVASHMMGDFTGREITIVDPLDELAKINGAPNSLYGVDTYFSANPGEPLLLSPHASVVQVKEGAPDQSIIARDVNDIRINKRDMRPEDFDTIERFFGYDEKDREHGIDGFGKTILAYDLFANGGLYLDWQMVERIENGDQDNAYDFLTEKEKAKSEEYMKPFRSAYNLIKSDLPENPSESDYGEALERLFERIVTGEVDIAEHPEFHDEIIETIRVLSINKLIKEKGGKVEKAGGQSQYMADEEFKEKERSVVSAIGFKSGLHDNNIEGWMEEVFQNTRSKATSGKYDEGTLTFDWSEYDDSNLWQTMATGSWQNRRYMVRSGMLSFTPPKVKKNQERSLVSAPADWA